MRVRKDGSRYFYCDNLPCFNEIDADKYIAANEAAKQNDAPFALVFCDECGKKWDEQVSKTAKTPYDNPNKI